MVSRAGDSLMDVTFHTKLSVSECQQRLNQAFTPKRTLRGFLFGSEPTWGQVKGLRFHMYRKQRFGNMFFPYLFGVIESGQEGTFVKAKVHFPLASILLSVFFVLLGLLFQVNNLVTLSLNGNWFTLLWPLLVSGLLCGTVIVSGVIFYFHDGAFLKLYLQRLLSALS